MIRQKSLLALYGQRLYGAVPAVVDSISQGAVGTNIIIPNYPTPQINDMILVIATNYDINRAATACTASGLSFSPLSTQSGFIRAWYAYSPDTLQRSVTVTLENVSGSHGAHVLILRHISLSNPLDNGVSYGSLPSASNQVAPGITVINPSSMLLSCVSTLDDNTLFVTEPGWTQTAANNHSTVFGSAIAHKIAEAPGNSGTIAWSETTGGPDTGYYLTFALKRM